MSADEAIKQLSFQQRLVAHKIKSLIEESAQKALDSFSVQYRSDLWVERMNVTRAGSLGGLRKKKHNITPIRSMYSHLFVKLTEGAKPPNYYTPEPTRGELAEKYFESRADLRIKEGL